MNTKTVTIAEPLAPEEQPALRFRMFSASYVCPGTKLGSRILIRDLRHKTRKFISYDDEKRGSTSGQATTYLRSIGITVDALGLAREDSDCFFLSLDIKTPLK